MRDLYSYLFATYRKYLQLRLRLRAFLTGKVFACNALHGFSGYNITIHSDLTVSCNCQDFDNTGYLGDLGAQSLEEVFRGEVAQAFRRKLASRKFPVNLCCSCPELILVSKKEINTYLHSFRMPHRGIMVENTSLCNYSCRLCKKRHEYLQFRRHKMLPEGGIEKISRLIRENQIELVFFYNLGEPFLSANVAHEIRVLRENNERAKIIVSTNGACLDSEEKMQAALLVDHIMFSVDGVDQESMVRYQKGGDFDKAFNNMRRLIQLRNEEYTVNTIEWRYVLFRGNDQPDQIRKAVEMAREINVDIISFIPGSAEIYNRSLNYRWHPFFQKLGTKIRLWEGREIDFRHERKTKAWALQDVDG